MSKLKLQIASDVHCEFHQDGGKSFFSHLKSDADVLVLPGDICSGHHIRSVMQNACSIYPEVVSVLGNHEFYGCPVSTVNSNVEEAQEQNKNLHYLRNEAVYVKGQRFVGCTLWFEDDPLNILHEKFMQDFFSIENLRDWVYEENKQSMSFLHRTVQQGDVVVTHHLPSHRSTPERFKRSGINRFFVCDMESMIEKLQPKLWIHGHTHDSADYMIGETRVICNPFGYAGYETNEDFKDKLIVEV